MLALAVFLLAANIAVSACFFLLMKRRFSRRRIMRDVEKELDLLYKDLQREIDNSVSIIEDRTAALKKLVAAADKRILLAASEIEKREKAASFDLGYAGKLGGSEKTGSEKIGIGALEVYTRKQIAERAAEAAQRSAKGAAEAAKHSAKGVAAVPPSREQVVLLARQDISPDEIAKILSLPQSEVDLILALDL